MHQPDIRDVHIDVVLSNISVAFLQNPTNYIAQRVFPIVRVDKQSDKYYVLPREAFLRDDVRRRAPGTESAGSGWVHSTAPYYADTWALHKDIPDPIRRNADPAVNLDRLTTRFLTGQMQTRHEVQWVNDFFKTGVWGTDRVGGTNLTVWSDYTNSDPMADIDDGKEQIISTTGFDPNTLVLGYRVFRRLKNHPDIIDRLKYTSSDNVTADILARMFEVDRVLVTRAIKATNIEGVSPATYGFIHGNHAWLGYVAPDPGLEVASAGYTFMWTGVSQGLGLEASISNIRMPAIKSDRLEIEAAWDNVVIAPELGYFFSGAVA